MTYYKILGVNKDAVAQEIKSAYRKLAFECHPDRNPDNIAAEEKFKQISEAYAVLIDPIKRGQYDRAQVFGGFGQRSGPGFSYTQEEIFRDLFQNQEASKIFKDLFAEFERAGFRADPKFFQQVFFRGSPFVVGGAIVFGSLAGVWKELFGAMNQGQTPMPMSGKKPGFLAKLGGKAFKYLIKRALLPANGAAPGPMDISYDLSITPKEAINGKKVELALGHTANREVLKISIPPGVRHNARLRVRGRGRETPFGRGDMFVVVSIEQED